MAMKGTYIFVIDRGFVMVARAAISKKLAFHWRIYAGRTVRQWGTDQGLAQLVNGPRPNTKLDPVEKGYLPFRAIIKIVEVKEDVWKAHLS